MSKAAKKRHIRDSGMCCPYCKADMEFMDYHDLDPVENGDIEQKVQCMQCKRYWKDIFRLVDVEELI